MTPNPEPAFSRRRLTPIQIGLIIFIGILFLANAVLAIGAYLNITATNEAFVSGYVVTDFSKIQRDILRLHLDTQEVLLNPEMDLDAVLLRRSLLESQLRQAIGEVVQNERVLAEFQVIEVGLEEYDQLLADLGADPSPERRAEAVPEFEVLFESLEQTIITATNNEDNQLFETISSALNSQRTTQTFLLILSTLFLLAIVLLVLSLRTAVAQDFNRAYQLLAQELAERLRVEKELVSAKEEADEANRAKSDFISLVSHELKVPMTSIHGYAELLKGGAAGELNDHQVRFLDSIRNSVDQMTRLVSDLADISRIEAGRLALDIDRISVSMLFDQVVSSNMAAVSEKEQELIVELPEDLPVVQGDHMRLVQILNNLVSNANKYTPEKGSIVIRAVSVDGANGSDRPMVQITVEDNGLGIHPDEQEKIFSKFFRAEDDQVRLESGTGLGLNITRYLVELHQGRIWFESGYREGTRFHFTLPVF
jgi:signal transduction histidine kinase